MEKKKKRNNYVKVVGMFTTSDVVRATGRTRKTVETHIGLPTHTVGTLRRKYFSGEEYAAIIGRLKNMPND